MRLPDFPSSVTLALVASLGLSWIPGGRYALYPLRIFATWAHECSHAVAVRLLGGQVTSIRLEADTSGVTRFRLPPGRLRQSLVASAGYLGTTLLGCGLYWLCRHLGLRYSGALCWVLAALWAASGLFWVRNLFGALAVGAWVATLGSAARWGSPSQLELLIVFLALQTALGALMDIRELYGLSARSQSDAHVLQSLLGLPAWFWATLWLGLSCVAVAWVGAHTP